MTDLQGDTRTHRPVRTTEIARARQGTRAMSRMFSGHTSRMNRSSGSRGGSVARCSCEPRPPASRRRANALPVSSTCCTEVRGGAVRERAYGPGPVRCARNRRARMMRCDEAKGARVGQHAGHAEKRSRRRCSARNRAGSQGARYAHSSRSPAPKARQSSTHCACASGTASSGSPPAPSPCVTGRTH